jgi:hypothetical protein
MPHNIKSHKIRKIIEAMKLKRKLRLLKRKKIQRFRRIPTGLMRSVLDNSD